MSTTSTAPTHLQMLAQIAESPYAWPGGYTLYALTDDGGALCADCCRTEDGRIKEAIPQDGFYIQAIIINYEEHHLRCDHCNSIIEAAYDDDDDDD